MKKYHTQNIKNRLTRFQIKKKLPYNHLTDPFVKVILFATTMKMVLNLRCRISYWFINIIIYS